MTLQKISTFVFCCLLSTCFLGSPLFAQEKETLATAEATSEKPLGFIEALELHLKAVETKDVELLESTLADSDSMFLILPNGSFLDSKKAFVESQGEWFKEKSNWTIDMNIIYSDVTDDYGIAIVEAMYREPERNGKPYFHKMFVSYALKKIKGEWKVIKDHASTIEKSE